MPTRPENWQYKLQPHADSMIYDVRILATNTLVTALPRLLVEIVPPEHISKGTIGAKFDRYTNPDKFWLRAVFEATYRELQKPKHVKELSRYGYKAARQTIVACWQDYMDCPNELLPKDC